MNSRNPQTGFHNIFKQKGYKIDYPTEVAVACTDWMPLFAKREPWDLKEKLCPVWRTGGQMGLENLEAWWAVMAGEAAPNNFASIETTESLESLESKQQEEEKKRQNPI